MSQSPRSKPRAAMSARRAFTLVAIYSIAAWAAIIWFIWSSL